MKWMIVLIIGYLLTLIVGNWYDNYNYRYIISTAPVVDGVEVTYSYRGDTIREIITVDEFNTMLNETEAKN